jgi:hypothetical protein
MAGTAGNQDSTKVLRGPAKVWLKVAIPAAAARLTLHTDGSPESVANPNAKQLGLTKAGTKISMGLTVQNSEADELTAPYRTTITADEMIAEGEWLQVLDLTLWELLIPNGTFATASGYEEVRIGGRTAIAANAQPSVAIIAPTLADPTKFVVAHIYQAVNTSGAQLTINKAEDSAAPFKLEGRSITSRASGDQVGCFWRQIA